MELAEWVERFGQAPQSSGFVLDFDGTLAPIVADPRDAMPLPEVPSLLEDLAREYKSVTLLTGRQANDLETRVHAKGVRYVGLYGAEEIVDGVLVQPDDAPRWRGMASRLARDAEALLVTEGWQGCEVEYKDVAVSIHYRNAADRDHARDAVLTWAQTAAARRGFVAGTGRMVVELRPVGVSKAAAFEGVVTRDALDHVLLAGDDLTDVEAMRHAGVIMDGRVLRVGVGSSEQPIGIEEFSDLQVASCHGVVEVLQRFLL